MKTLIVCVLWMVLIGIIPPLLPAQQSQNTQKPNPEIEALKQRVSELEKQLQIVENVEKLELARNYTDAQAKLLNAQFEKFERDLKDSNDEWLGKWSDGFVGIIVGIIVVAVTILSSVGGVFWFWLRSTSDRLIADRVEMSLNGFKAAVGKVEKLENQIKVLEKERAASMLEGTFQPELGSRLGYPKENEARREKSLEEISEESLLDVFEDEKYHLAIRQKAAEVLVRKSPPMVSPAFKFLNSAIDSDSNITPEIEHQLRRYIYLLGMTHTRETYQELEGLLNRLLTENPKHRGLFLTWTVFSLGRVSGELNMRETVPTLQAAIPHLVRPDIEGVAIGNLAVHFHRFNEPEGIKKILDHHGASLPSEIVDKCLDLLQKHDPAFVEVWRAQKAADGTES